MTVLREVCDGTWLGFDRDGRALPPVRVTAEDEKEFEKFYALFMKVVKSR